MILFLIFSKLNYSAHDNGSKAVPPLFYNSLTNVGLFVLVYVQEIYSIRKYIIVRKLL